MATPLLLQQFVEADRAPVRGWNDLWEFEGIEVSARGTQHEARLDKSRLLRCTLAMESLRVLPSDGIPRKELLDLPLTRIARAAGYKHASSYARALKRCPALLEHKRLWGSPAQRQWAFPESQRQRKKNGPWKGYNMPSARELATHPTLGKYFAGKTGGGGYHQRAGFIHHPNFPGTANDRVVLGALSKLGLFAGERMLEKTTQRRISAETGLCSDTVRRILRKYAIYTIYSVERDPDGRWRRKKAIDPETATLKTERVEQRGQFPIFRIVALRGHWEKDGAVLTKWEAGARWKQPPNRIVYLGDRMTDARVAVVETRRLIELGAKRRYTAELWWEHVAQIHARELRRLVGTETQAATFRGCVRMAIQAAGLHVPLKALDTLFPEWRGPT